MNFTLYFFNSVPGIDMSEILAVCMVCSALKSNTYNASKCRKTSLSPGSHQKLNPITLPKIVICLD